MHYTRVLYSLATSQEQACAVYYLLTPYAQYVSCFRGLRFETGLYVYQRWHKVFHGQV